MKHKEGLKAAASSSMEHLRSRLFNEKNLNAFVIMQTSLMQFYLEPKFF